VKRGRGIPDRNRLAPDVGAAGKSAQIPLMSGCPMQWKARLRVGLIHAAPWYGGVYMVARSHVIFERAPMALTVVAIIERSRSVCRNIGIAQTDIKKVWRTRQCHNSATCSWPRRGAFSAASSPNDARSSRLALSRGRFVIHGVGGEQDMRKMGGLRSTCR